MQLGHRILVLGLTAVLLVSCMGAAALVGSYRGEAVRRQLKADREQLEALFGAALEVHGPRYATRSADSGESGSAADLLAHYRHHAHAESDETERQDEIRLAAALERALAEVRSTPPDSPEGSAARSRLLERLDEAIELERAETQRAVLEAGNLIGRTRIVATSVPLLAIVLVAALSLGLLLPLRRRVRELLDGAERFARGEETAGIPEDGNDELARVAAAWNAMHRELRRTTVSRAELEEHLQALREARAQLVVADRMALVGTLAAGVAHEINNPLAYLSANLEWLRTRLLLAEDAPSEMLQAIEEAADGALRIGAIVGDLRTFSREDDTRMEIDLRQVVDDAVRLGGHEIRELATLETALGEVPPVLGNRMRLGQVVLNLLVNAAQAFAGRENGWIRVRTATDGGGRVVVEVEDDGPGVPEEIRHRIFDPFFTTKPVGVGTGLGLSVCNGIVTSHGGELQYESRAGGGSVFRVILEASPLSGDRVA